MKFPDVSKRSIMRFNLPRCHRHSHHSSLLQCQPRNQRVVRVDSRPHSLLRSLRPLPPTPPDSQLDSRPVNPLLNRLCCPLHNPRVNRPLPRLLSRLGDRPVSPADNPPVDPLASPPCSLPIPLHIPR